MAQYSFTTTREMDLAFEFFARLNGVAVTDYVQTVVDRMLATEVGHYEQEQGVDLSRRYVRLDAAKQRQIDAILGS